MLNKLPRWRSVAAALALLCAFAPAALAVSDIQDYSTTAASNTDIGGNTMAEGMPPSAVNNGIRELIAQLKRGVANQGSNIASASTTAICATGTSIYANVTGTTTITSFGTAAAGCWRIVTFTGALTITHNATSLILPGAANITTSAGAVAGFVSEGSGNWRMIWFSQVPILSTANTFTAAQAITLTAAGNALSLTSTDAGAGLGPGLLFDRNSASPAASDAIGNFEFRGRDSAGNTQAYGFLYCSIDDPTNGSEDSSCYIETPIAGTSTVAGSFGNGVRIGNNPTGGYKGTGTINAGAGLYIAGHGTVAQVIDGTPLTAYTTLGTILPFDDTIPQITEGDEVTTVTISPTNASSTLRIEANVNGTVAAANADWACALFVDATANAISARPASNISTSNMTTLHWVHSLSAGSTSSRTYRLRCGSATATDLKVNGTNTARLFGGVNASTLTVTEILPQ